MAVNLNGFELHCKMCLSMHPLTTCILQCLHLDVSSSAVLGKGGGGVVRADVKAAVVGDALQKETDVQVCLCSSNLFAASLGSHVNAVAAGVFQFGV